MVSAVTRLPGVTFEVAPRVPRETLPRMDVCGFVGFASAGPVDVPVMIESAARFREVFGPDVTLASDALTGRPEASYLGPSVEAFFRCGGIRSWVVRVAREPAVPAFSLPGVVRATPDPARWSLAMARARSGGTWADALRAGTSLESRWVAVRPGPGAFDPGARTLALAPTGELLAGDLLRVSSPGRAGAVLLVVDALAASQRAAIVSWREGDAYWLRPAPATAAEPTGVYRLTGAGPVAADVEVVAVDPPGGGPRRYELGLASAGDARAGDVMRVDYSGYSVAVPVGGPQPARASTTRTTVAGGEGVVSSRGAPGGAGWWSDPDAALFVERLTFEISLWEEKRLVARIGDLAFSGRHPRSWRRLPDDVELFRTLEALAAGSEAGATADHSAFLRQELWTESFSPRFPLATTPDGTQAVEEDDLWLPLAVSGVRDPETARGPLADDRDPLEREGLEEFGAALFVDPGLAQLSTREVLRVAEERAFLTSPPRPARGLHALFPIEEVTAVAVPDATQRGWERAGVEPPAVLDPPILVADPTGPCALWLSWSEVAGATSYELQESPDPAFDVAETLARDARSEIGLEYEGCPQLRRFRVRALRDATPGPWSNTATAVVPGAEFDPCDAPLAATELLPGGAGSPPAPMVWTAVPEATSYELQESAWPDFRSADTFTLTGTETDPPAPGDAAIYSRVRPLRESAGGLEVGPWSNTVIVGPRPRIAWALRPPTDAAPDLRAVQVCLLRMCAARGDVLAVLSFPRGWRDDDVLPHVGLLAGPAGETTGDPLPAGVLELDSGEGSALGFAAAYHPWIVVRSVGAGGEDLRSLPPDGAVCGRMARRTIARGAWIAPANEVVEVALGLDPLLDGGALSRLASGSVNVIRDEPRGAVIAGADTLSDDPYLRPINVRRLLILLRRFVLREGDTYVFQPHDATFRSMVVRKLETMLADLFRRGAFAGRTPAEAFVVVGDDTVNPPPAVDQGRFTVDLLVAPSVPAKFVRVRLLQSGPGAVLVEEASA